MSLLVSQAELLKGKELPLEEKVGEIQGRQVVVEKGDTKFASIFRKVAHEFRAFFFAAAKFVLKTALFVTGISPLLYITKYFWNCLNLTNNSQAKDESIPHENLEPSKECSISKKEIEELCAGLSSFHVSDKEVLVAPEEALRSSPLPNTAQVTSEIQTKKESIVNQNLEPSKGSLGSMKEIDSCPTRLNNYHASEKEASRDDAGSEAEICAQLRAEIECTMQRVNALINSTPTQQVSPEVASVVSLESVKQSPRLNKAPVAPVVSEKGLRRSGRVRKAPLRYGFD